MKKLILFSLIAMFFSSFALAQSGKGKNKGQSLYDRDTVITVSGKVTSISTGESISGSAYSVEMDIDTGSSVLTVRLGPAWFIEEQDFDIDKNDKVTVTGSKVKIDGDVFVVAATVEKNGKVLKLRESDGTPLWKGKGRGKNR